MNKEESECLFEIANLLKQLVAICVANELGAIKRNNRSAKVSHMLVKEHLRLIEEEGLETGLDND